MISCNGNPEPIGVSSDIVSVVRCPACCDVLQLRNHALCCQKCTLQYPITDGILRLDASADNKTRTGTGHSIASVSSQQEVDDRDWYKRFYSERINEDRRVSSAVIDRYSKLLHPHLFELEKWYELIGDIKRKRVLYLACGIDTSPVLLAKRGAEVWAFDLVFEALQFQRKLALANDTADRTHFVTGSCACLPFHTASFDIAAGVGIWHHLQEDLERPCLELARILKEGGFAVFQEPIARSSILVQLRRCIPVPTPPDASPRWCRPLNCNALDSFAKYCKVQAYYFRFVASLDRLFGATPLEVASVWARWFSYALRYIDYLLLRIPGLNRFARSVVFKLTAYRNR